MIKNIKTKFQKIHYSKEKPNFLLNSFLSFGEFFYKNIVVFKNFLYEKKILKETKVGANVVCVGNLTTGGVGKTPIVISLANEYSQNEKVAVISRGYGAKISNKNVNVIKDENGIKFENGFLCGDEPFQIAKKTNKNVVVITCRDRKKAIEFVVEKYSIKTVILDDGFSNRKVKKDKAILVIDSKMRFGNSCLLPKGPLREPLNEIKRSDEIILVDKGDENIQNALSWITQFKKPFKLCKMTPARIYNFQTGATIKNLKKEKAIAFCAIGQPKQFFNFAKEFYEIIEIEFCDHYKYAKKDIDNLIKLANQNNISTFITTQKDETKLSSLVAVYAGYSFNVLELKTEIKNII